jgi:hypothetical protein
MLSLIALLSKWPLIRQICERADVTGLAKFPALIRNLFSPRNATNRSRPGFCLPNDLSLKGEW